MSVVGVVAAAVALAARRKAGLDARPGEGRAVVGHQRFEGVELGRFGSSGFERALS